MKLLFDENISVHLVQLLGAEFPGSSHADLLGLRGAADATIWEYAKRDGFTIVSKDNDFRQRLFLHGFPPKVVWLSIGNGGTRRIVNLLRDQAGRIRRFVEDPEEGLLILSD